jgi:hypothetical protein
MKNQCTRHAIFAMASLASCGGLVSADGNPAAVCPAPASAQAPANDTKIPDRQPAAGGRSLRSKQRGIRRRAECEGARDGQSLSYGVTGNFRMLSRLRCEVARLWRNRGKRLNWERFQGKLQVFPLFPARIIHSSMR